MSKARQQSLNRAIKRGNAVVTFRPGGSIADVIWKRGYSREKWVAIKK